MDQQMNLSLRRTGRVQLHFDPVPRRRAILIDHEAFDAATGVIDGFAKLAESWQEKTKIQEPVVWVTDWIPCSTPPVRDGFYDVRVIDEPEVTRMLFNKELSAWTVEGWPFPRVFGRGRLWRGLAQDPDAK